MAAAGGQPGAACTAPVCVRQPGLSPPAASVGVVQEQMLLSGHGQPAWMPCFLADERSTPWADLAWLQLALPLNPSLGRAAKGRSQRPSRVHTGQPGPSQPRPAPVPPAASRRLPTPNPGSFLTSAGRPLQIPPPPLLWGSSETTEGPKLEDPAVSRALVVLTPTSAPAAIPCGS